MPTKDNSSDSHAIYDTDSLSVSPYAYTIPEFCDRYNISVATYYRNRDTMPRSVSVGKHPRILIEDIHEWKKHLIAR